MNFNIQVTNTTLTEDEQTFIREKLLSGLRTLGSADRDPAQLNVEIERRTNSRAGDDLYRAEVNLSLPGTFVRVEEFGSTVPEATTKARHVLMRKTRKWRQRVIAKRRRSGRTDEQ